MIRKLISELSARPNAAFSLFAETYYFNRRTVSAYVDNTIMPCSDQRPYIIVTCLGSGIYDEPGAVELIR